MKKVKEETGEKKKIEVPICEKVTLSIEEAAAYSNIGILKLYELTDSPLCPFVLYTGPRKRLIKRRAFEKFLETNVTI